MNPAAGPVPLVEPAPLVAEGFLLAGGASSRFGSEKSLALLDGTPLIAHAVDLFLAVGFGVRIAGARTPALADYAPIVEDIIPGSGPLSGIHAALHAAAAEYSLFLPVDMPLIPPALLAFLMRRAAITRASVTCLRVCGLLQPFPVLLHPASLPRITAALQNSTPRSTPRAASCFRLWQSFPDLDAPALESLVQTGQIPPDPIPPALWFHSANTPDDLTLLRRWLALRAPSRTLEA